MSAALQTTSGQNAGNNPFDARVILGLVVAGIIGFVGFWALTAFAPQLSSGRDAGGHAMSRSAVGFAGVVELARAGDIAVSLVRDPQAGLPGANESGLGGLLVLTPTPGTTRRAIDERIAGVDGSVLIVLPKYETAPAPGQSDRVGAYRRLENAAALLSNDVGKHDFLTEVATPSAHSIAANLWNDGEIALVLPPHLQTMTGPNLEPLISVDDGIILAELSGRGSTYVLSDPDLINNLAMKDYARAATALALLRSIAGPNEPVGFDVTLNGLGTGGRSLLLMVFTPPFLGLTMFLLFGGLLALWQGFVRFGPPWRVERTIAFGKGALVDSNAQLIIQARRVPNFTARYGAMVREAAAVRLHAPTNLAGAALDAWLDRFKDSKGRTFAGLLSRLESAKTTIECVEHARNLGEWRRDVLRDSE